MANELKANELKINELKTNELVADRLASSKLAFVFPGQGGGGAGKEVIATNIAQPTIFKECMETVAMLKERGIVADGVAGFSLGEVPAVAYAGLLSEEDAYDFVCYRAEVMHQATIKHKGGMMAILGLSAEAVEEVCREVDGAYPVNYNAPGQVVAAYKAESLDSLKAAVAAVKGKCIVLPVAGAFHSPLMDDAAASVKRYLNGLESKGIESKGLEFNQAKIPIYSNVTGKVYGQGKDIAKELLARQVNSPVLWQATIEQMISDGFDTFIEAGPGKVLTAMIKKIDKNVKVLNALEI